MKWYVVKKRAGVAGEWLVESIHNNAQSAYQRQNDISRKTTSYNAYAYHEVCKESDLHKYVTRG